MVWTKVVNLSTVIYGLRNVAKIQVRKKQTHLIEIMSFAPLLLLYLLATWGKIAAGCNVA